MYSNIFVSGYIVPEDRGFCKGLSGGDKSMAFPGCPVLRHASKEGIPLGLPWEALLAELCQPLGRRVLGMRCLLKKVSSVTFL